jgi:energy-coupling factor transporter ATP-binding protein EcfA2
MELLIKLNQKGMTIVMVTHSPEGAGYAKRIMRVSDGKLVGDNSNLRSLDHFVLSNSPKEPGTGTCEPHDPWLIPETGF